MASALDDLEDSLMDDEKAELKNRIKENLFGA